MRVLFVFGASIVCISELHAQKFRLPSPSRPPLVSSNASSRPLGGIPPKPVVRRSKSQAPRYVVPIYYVPNAFDYNYDEAPPDTSPQPPAPRARFARAQTRPDTVATTTYEPVAPPPENYYLIAYKDHTIYPALSYWIEGDTLHYVTTDETQNQSSMAFIDVDQTTKLNADRAVPFTVPAK